MGKTFLLIYGIGISMTGIGWLCYSAGLSLLIALAISSAVISVGIVITAIVFSYVSDD